MTISRTIGQVPGVLGTQWAELDWAVCKGCCSVGKIRATLITPTLHSTQVQTFHGDLLQHMEKNTKLDMQFIKVSLATHLGPPSPSQARLPLLV